MVTPCCTVHNSCRAAFFHLPEVDRFFLRLDLCRHMLSPIRFPGCERSFHRKRTGQDRTGQDRTGQDRTGQDRTGQDRTGQDRTGQDRTGQDRTGQDRTGQDNETPSLAPLTHSTRTTQSSALTSTTTSTTTATTSSTATTTTTTATTLPPPQQLLLLPLLLLLFCSTTLLFSTLLIYHTQFCSTLHPGAPKNSKPRQNPQNPYPKREGSVAGKHYATPRDCENMSWRFQRKTWQNSVAEPSGAFSLVVVRGRGKGEGGTMNGAVFLPPRGSDQPHRRPQRRHNPNLCQQRDERCFHDVLFDAERSSLLLRSTHMMLESSAAECEDKVAPAEVRLKKALQQGVRSAARGCCRIAPVLESRAPTIPLARMTCRWFNLKGSPDITNIASASFWHPHWGGVAVHVCCARVPPIHVPHTRGVV